MAVIYSCVICGHNRRLLLSLRSCAPFSLTVAVATVNHHIVFRNTTVTQEIGFCCRDADAQSLGE